MKFIDILKKLKFKKRNVIPDEAPTSSDGMTFVNDIEMETLTTIKEYNIWYEGDDKELMDFYTTADLTANNGEPIYRRNTSNFFWAISSTEFDIKRTHSGQPRNIVDTLVNIISYPLINTNEEYDEILKKILEENEFEVLYNQEQLPLTLVEGWGAYKINWDKDISNIPVIIYYRAENVDFIYSNNRITGIIFKDHYIDRNGKKYTLMETRRLKLNNNDEQVLVIEKKLYENPNIGDYKEVDIKTIEDLEDIQTYIEIGPTNILFAVPSVFYKNTSKKTNIHGRSIFTGKIGLFDDLDQCLSQASNSVRKSTPIEYFDSEYLERDSNGMPLQPKSYDRKYSVYKGQRNSNGESVNNPVTVTQPSINFDQYTNEAISILMTILNGIMSPASMGIDISKKDNADAQREKEKVTIFTRNSIIKIETRIINELLKQALCAYEFMNTGVITKYDYKISVKYNEFADESFENKLEKLGKAFDSETISEKMYMRKLYGDSLTEEEYEEELEWLKEHHTQPRDEGFKGITGNGENIEGMFDGEEEY